MNALRRNLITSDREDFVAKASPSNIQLFYEECSALVIAFFCCLIIAVEWRSEICDKKKKTTKIKNKRNV